MPRVSVGRLAERFPGQFGKPQHSIVQRLLKELRIKAAGQLFASKEPAAIERATALAAVKAWPRSVGTLGRPSIHRCNRPNRPGRPIDPLAPKAARSIFPPIHQLTDGAGAGVLLKPRAASELACAESVVDRLA